MKKKSKTILITSTLFLCVSAITIFLIYKHDMEKLESIGKLNNEISKLLKDEKDLKDNVALCNSSILSCGGVAKAEDLLRKSEDLLRKVDYLENKQADTIKNMLVVDLVIKKACQSSIYWDKANGYVAIHPTDPNFDAGQQWNQFLCWKLK